MNPKVLRSFVPASVQPVRLQERSNGQMPLIVGYGAVFYREGQPGTEYWLWDNIVERIAPTAFDRAIREDDIRGLKNHDPNLLLGRSKSNTMRLSVDAVGLRYEIEPPDTQAGHDTIKELRRGDLDGSSFSFTIAEGGEQVNKVRMDDGPTVYIRNLTELQVYDVGPVTFPAYSATSSGVRCYRSINKHDADEMQAIIDRCKVDVVTRSEIMMRCREIELSMAEINA